jgi:hypothetical protein
LGLHFERDCKLIVEIRQEAHNFSRRAGIFLFDLLFNHRPLYKTLGWLNKRSDFLASVFVAYPASEKYADAYFSQLIKNEKKWSPALCALLYQNGKWTLGLGISALEEEIREASKENLEALVGRTERIRNAVGADYKTFAGILPGILHRRGITEEDTEAEVTVRVILEAEKLVKEKEGLTPDVPLVILGGNGYIGSRLIDSLPRDRIYPVEKSNTGGDWPSHLRGEEALLINVANSSALREYRNRIWPGLHLLNEVYPAPGGQDLKAFARHDNSVYHVVGVDATAYPSFPRSYAGGIPCCATRPSDSMKPIVRKLG